jgi:hypothetical protein
MEKYKKITHDYCCMYSISFQDVVAKIIVYTMAQHFIIRAGLILMILHVEVKWWVNGRVQVFFK